MSPGGAFAAWIFMAALLIAPISTVLGSLAWFLTRWKSRRLHGTFIIGGLFLPVVFAIYLLLCIFLMGIASIYEGRDFGMGDSYKLPLNNHFVFSAIDDPTYADISVDGDAGTLGDSAAFSNVVQLQQDGDWLPGLARQSLQNRAQASGLPIVGFCSTRVLMSASMPQAKTNYGKLHPVTGSPSICNRAKISTRAIRAPGSTRRSGLCCSEWAC